MAYQVLARKWRPQDFSSLVGQEPIVTALRNAIEEGRIAQAYLFSGIRGVGKTTAARVLAKALNCERGPAPDPCNECVPCREITAGADLDVIEVDAATYSKVEQVRELTEGLRYGPARDRYKVVVIDEIHRLSRQAFDALLKIVEEPPPHLVFIFATTEIDAVPATVLSRCQEFHFRRVPSETLTAHLGRIAGDEGIDASEGALRLIARAGEGSVRDAVALLDQLATFGSGAVPDEEAVRLLGGLDTSLFAELLDAVTAGDRDTVTGVVHRIEDEGWDPRHVYAQFLAYCRDALHLALDPARTGDGQAAGDRLARIDLPREEAERLAERARRTGYPNLLRLLHQLLASEETVRRSDASTLALEIAWLRAAELPRLTRIEEVLSGSAPPGPAAASGSRETGRPPGGSRSSRNAAPRPTAAASATADPAPAEPEPAEAPEPPAPDPPPIRPNAAAPATAGGVETFLETLADLKAPLAGHVRKAHELRFLDGTLEIAVAADDDLLWSRLEKPPNRELIDRAVAATWGPDASWRPRRVTVDEAPRSAPSTARPSRDHDATDNPTVQAVLEIFQDTVERVDTDEREDA
ncbi:MAG: DNA polymerase III subunit gamma/tau [Thermoanaerobaculia bacterium]